MLGARPVAWGIAIGSKRWCTLSKQLEKPNGCRCNDDENKAFMNALKILLLFSLAVPAVAQDDFVPLPAGVRPVWDTSKAFHESTATREKICINGLWRWQPASVLEESVPTKNWGYFKVPG